MKEIIYYCDICNKKIDDRKLSNNLEFLDIKKNKVVIFKFLYEDGAEIDICLNCAQKIFKSLSDKDILYRLSYPEFEHGRMHLDNLAKNN